MSGRLLSATGGGMTHSPRYVRTFAGHLDSPNADRSCVRVVFDITLTDRGSRKSPLRRQGADVALLLGPRHAHVDPTGAPSLVAAHEASRARAWAVGDPGSAVKIVMVSPGSDLRSMVS